MFSLNGTVDHLAMANSVRGRIKGHNVDVGFEWNCRSVGYG